MSNQIMGLVPIRDNTNAKALDPPTPYPLQVSRTCGFPGLPEPVASIAGAVGQRAKPKLAAEHSHQTYKLQGPPPPRTLPFDLQIVKWPGTPRRYRGGGGGGRYVTY